MTFRAMNGMKTDSDHSQLRRQPGVSRETGINRESGVRMRSSNRRSEKREGRVNYPHYPLAGPILFYGAVTLMAVLTLAVQVPRFLPAVEIAGWVF